VAGATDTSWLALAYVIAEWVIRLVMLFIVPWRRPPSTATAWLLLIYFWPVPGLLIYLLVGRSRLSRRHRDKLSELKRRLLPTLGHLATHPLIAMPTLPAEMGPVAQISRRVAPLPELGGNAVTLIGASDQWLRQLIVDIEAASSSVHMAFYIARADDYTEPVFQALERAAARGVEVRLLVDDVGSADFMRGLRRRVSDTGIQLVAAMPRSRLWRRSSRFDLRNHRKLVIIDGRVGYTGSQNLISPDFREGLVYEDLMVRLVGPVVLELQLVFVGDWFVEQEEFLAGELYFPAPEAHGDVVAQGLPSGPEFPEAVQQRLMLSLIHASTQSIFIATPYFVPDEPTLIALKSAAQRGVDVRLVVSERLDRRIVQWAQESYYEELLEAGVRISRYPAGFLHAKTALFDGYVVQIGSANFDVRSFLLNAEFSLLFYSPAVACAMAAGFEYYEQAAERLELEQWVNERAWYRQMMENVARLASPLL